MRVRTISEKNIKVFHFIEYVAETLFHALACTFSVRGEIFKKQCLLDLHVFSKIISDYFQRVCLN